MKTVALIPIKLGSKRIPGKNIKPFYDGTPLMSFIQKTCLKTRSINETYIYCSDEAVIPYIVPGVLKEIDLTNIDEGIDVLRERIESSGGGRSSAVLV